MSDPIIDRDIGDLCVGQAGDFEVEITEEKMNAFAKLTGDVNCLHTDDDYAAKTRFGKRVVYGQLLNALLSRLVGHHLPGKRALYLAQDSQFVNPCFVGDVVRVSGAITAVHPAQRLIEIDTEICRPSDQTVLVRGKATVMVM